MAYSDTSYSDVGRVQQLLDKLGITRVRDGINVNRPDEVAALRDLGEAGFRLDLIVGGVGSNGTIVPSADQLSELAQLSPYTTSVEAPNEYDCSGDPNWVMHSKEFSRELAPLLRRSTGIRANNTLSPSFCKLHSIKEYGSPNQRLFGVGNVHFYGRGLPPEAGLESTVSEASRIDGSGIPIDVTETGYHSSDTEPISSESTSYSTMAIYLVRTLLDTARIGVRHTYLYELLDEKPDMTESDPEEHFGLAGDDYIPKPAFEAIRNLLHTIVGTLNKSDKHRNAFDPSVSVTSPTARAVVFTGSADSGALAVWSTSPVGATSLGRVCVDLDRGMRTDIFRPTEGPEGTSSKQSTHACYRASPVPTVIRFLRGS